ncbi:hypothetical protein OH77DRAFT_531222 [Trametes cingulata]|nr:hypothetical protein OH77DRAFT_531222 [Trametes cingulata]
MVIDSLPLLVTCRALLTPDTSIALEVLRLSSGMPDPCVSPFPKVSTSFHVGSSTVRLEVRLECRARMRLALAVHDVPSCRLRILRGLTRSSATADTATSVQSCPVRRGIGWRTYHAMVKFAGGTALRVHASMPPSQAIAGAKPRESAPQETQDPSSRARWYRTRRRPQPFGSICASSTIAFFRSLTRAAAASRRPAHHPQ